MNPGRVKVPYYALRRGGMLKINTPAPFKTGEKTREKI